VTTNVRIGTMSRPNIPAISALPSNVSALRNSLPARATSCWRTAQRRLFKAALDA